MNKLKFARVDKIVKGSQLVADGGFDCLSDGQISIVESDADGLWVKCSHGKHYLSGQLNEIETEYVGFYPLKN